MKICEADECQRAAHTRGLCQMHYQRLRRHGTTDIKFGRGGLLKKLMSRLDSTTDEDACWVWQGSYRGKYGSMKHNGKTRGAHQLMFYAHHGYFPEETRHTCDNPPCCNPKHLLPGTKQDNMQDRVDRGRSAKMPGRSNPNARYSKEQVDKVRDLFGQGYLTDQISEITGVHRSTVHRIKHGQK